MFRARHTPAPLTQLRAQPGALRPRLCKGGPAPEPQLYTREPAPLDPGKAESPQSAAARPWGLGRGPDPHRRVPGVPGPRPARPPAPARERPPDVAAQAELHSGEERRAREGGERPPGADRGPRPPAAARPRPSSGQAGRGARARRPGTGPGSPRAGDRFGGAAGPGRGPARGSPSEPGTSTARVNKEAVENCTYVYDRRGSRAAGARAGVGPRAALPWPG